MGAVCCQEEGGSPIEQIAPTAPAEAEKAAVTADAEAVIPAKEPAKEEEAPAKAEEPAAEAKEAAPAEAAPAAAAEAPKEEAAPAAEEAAQPPAEAPKEQAEVATSAESPTYCEYTVKLTRADPQARWGFGLSKAKGDLVITDPKGSYIEAWHKANPDKVIIPGDEVLSANGVTGDPVKLLDAMKPGSAELELKLRRQVRFEVTFEKKGPLGLQFQPKSTCISSIQSGASSGPVDKFNLACTAAAAEIRKDDTLTLVNGKAATIEAIKEIKDGTSCTLVFERTAIK